MAGLLSSCRFCCCTKTITLIYEPEWVINYHIRSSSENIHLTTQIQLSSRFAIESKFLKVKQGSPWITNGAKRGRMEIIAEILLFCDHQKAKTSIMYKANLNYVQVQSQLKFLTAQGMLSSDTGKFTTTEKGYRFLELFMGLYDILSDEKV